MKDKNKRRMATKIACVSALLLGLLVLSTPYVNAAEENNDILDMVMPSILATVQNQQTLKQLGATNGISTNELDHILVAHYTDPLSTVNTKSECTHTYQVTAPVRLCNTWNWKLECTNTYEAQSATYACDTWAHYKQVMNCEWHIDAPVSSSMRFRVDQAQTAYNTFIANLVSYTKKKVQEKVGLALGESAVASAAAALPTEGTGAISAFITVFTDSMYWKSYRLAKEIKDFIDANGESSADLINDAFPLLSSDNLKQSCGWSDWTRL